MSSRLNPYASSKCPATPRVRWIDIEQTTRARGHPYEHGKLDFEFDILKDAGKDDKSYPFMIASWLYKKDYNSLIRPILMLKPKSFARNSRNSKRSHTQGMSQSFEVWTWTTQGNVKVTSVFGYLINMGMTTFLTSVCLSFTMKNSFTTLFTPRPKKRGSRMPSLLTYLFVTSSGPECIRAV